MNPELLFSSKSVELKSLHGGEGTHGRMTWNVKYTGLATPIITIFGKACGGMEIRGRQLRTVLGVKSKEIPTPSLSFFLPVLSMLPLSHPSTSLGVLHWSPNG